VRLVERDAEPGQARQLRPAVLETEPIRPQSRDKEPTEGESRGADGSRARSGAPKAGSSGGIASARPRYDDDYAATGIGRSVYHDVQWIQMGLERSPAAEISVRYEFRDALVRLGLLPRPWPDDNALRRRERARGFEGAYSPEPPR